LEALYTTSRRNLGVLPIRHKFFTALIITFAGWNYSTVGCGHLGSPRKTRYSAECTKEAPSALVQTK